VELLERRESVVNRVATRSSTRNQEEEEETEVLLNRPPKRARQEDKSEQAGATLIPKEEGPSLRSDKDRFTAICKSLGDM
jgi:hypothetical protein